MVIEMFPAKQGDSFLLRLDNRKNILIDMGYIDTYKKHIKEKLLEIKKENQCIDLLVVTHIDEDHIAGAIEFFKENGNANNPKIIEVKEVWYNSYRHLQFEKEKIRSVSDFEKRQLKEIRLSDSRMYRRKTDEEICVSTKQGSTLAGYLYAFGYANNRWNSAFSYKAINLDSRYKIKLGDMKFYILSPNSKKLNSLSKLWFHKLLTIDNDFSLSDEEIFDDAYEMYIKNLKPIIGAEENKDISYSTNKVNSSIEDSTKKKGQDGSISNGASISFILEYKNKKFLFLADAHEDIILERLEKYEKEQGLLEFEAVKISHHGSIKNNFKWIKKVKAKKYLISTNGEVCGHPSLEMLKKIMQCNNEQKIFYFNYSTEISKSIDVKTLKEKYNYLVVVGNGKTLNIEVNCNDE